MKRNKQEISCLKVDDTGNTTIDPKRIMKIIEEYTYKLGNKVDEEAEARDTQSDESGLSKKQREKAWGSTTKTGITDGISHEFFEKIRNALPLRKAVGLDKVANEFMRELGPKASEAMRLNFNRILKGEIQMPASWNEDMSIKV